MATTPPATTPRLVLGVLVALLFGLVSGWWITAHSASRPVVGNSHASPLDQREAAAVGDDGSQRTRVPPMRASESSEVDATSTAGSLRIHTVDAKTQAPIPAVGILVAIADGRALAHEHRAVVTDQEGEAHFDALPTGPAHLRTDRGAEVDCAIAASAETSVVIRIAAGTDVEGEVVDADGAALPFASIVVETLGARRIGQTVDRADAAGHFALRALPPGRVYVGAIHPDHFPSTMEPVPERSGQGPMHVVLRMRGPGASVHGHVLAADGGPVPGAIVRIGGNYGEPEIRLSRDRFVGGCAPYVVTTDALGAFVADGLPTGPLEFLVQARGRAPRSTYLTLAPGRNDRTEIHVAAGARILGRVTAEDGRPLAGVRLRVSAFDPWQDLETTSRADGGFDLDGCEPARLLLHASMTGFVATTRSVVPDSSPLEIVLRDERMVAGRLVDGFGAALAGWSVGPHGGRGVRTDEDGRFTGLPRDRGFDAFPPDGRIAITPKIEQGDSGLVLRVPPPLMPIASILGRLVDADGRPRARCSVSLHRDDRFAGSATVDAQTGAFHFDHLVPGAYLVKVWSKAADEAPAWLPDPVLLHPAEERDLGTLRPDPRQSAGRVRVELARHDGVEVEHARGDVIDATTGRVLTTLLLSARDGRQQALLPGDYRFVFQSTNAPWTVQPFVVRAGEETVLALDLEAATRRSVFFPWPLPPGFPTEGAVQLSLADASGQLAWQETVDASALPDRFVPTLAASDYDLELRCADGRRFAGRFRIGSAALDQEPIVVTVQSTH